MNPPRLLDVFCGAGGVSVGYERAGFEVTGVDIVDHYDYPGELIVADALDVLADEAYLSRFAVIHASPPCPRYSTMTAAHTRDSHPDLIPPVRAALLEWGGAYVIENVVGAPLLDPVRLCGSSFGLRVRRHRLFESNTALLSLPCQHTPGAPVGVYGDHADSREYLRPNGSRRGAKAVSVADAQAALGIDWMHSWDDLTDAIPPAYAEFIGAQLVDLLAVAAA